MTCEACIIRAHLATIMSLGDIAPLTRQEAILIAFAAIYSEALLIDQHNEFPTANLQNHLMIAGIRAVHETQAGKIDRSILIARIDALDEQEKIVYSLRYEHSMLDRQIAEILKISEDDVVSLMLRALLKLTAIST